MTFFDKIKLIAFRDVPPSEVLTHDDLQSYKRLKAAQRVQTIKSLDIEKLAIYTFLLETEYNKKAISERAYRSMCETYENDIATLSKEILQSQKAKEFDDFLHRSSSNDEEYYD